MRPRRPWPCRALFAAVLLSLCVALPAWASTSSDVRTLMSRLASHGRFEPELWTQAEPILADPTLDVSPDDLALLLAPDAPLRAQQLGARVIRARKDPDLAPLALMSLLVVEITAHIDLPDVTEVLARSLEEMDAESLAAAADGVDVDRLLRLTGERVTGRWLRPLAGRNMEVPPLTPELRERGHAITRRWLDFLVERAPDSLISLRGSHGASGRHLANHLEALTLAALAESDDPSDRRILLEAVVQNQVTSPDVHEALAGWGGAWPPDTAHLVEQLPQVDPNPPLPLAPDLSGVEPLEPPSSPGRFLRLGGTPLGLPTFVWWLLRIGALVAVAAVVVRRWPRARPWVYRLAAVGLGVGLLVGIEGALALAGVEPPRMHSPTWSPNQPAQKLLWPIASGWVEVNNPGSRYQYVRGEPFEDRPRVITLGASSTFGSGLPREESWPVVAATVVEERGQPVEMVNLGVGGAVSDDVVFYLEQGLTLKPRIVVIHLGYNDFTYVPRMARWRGFDPRLMAVRHGTSRLRMATALGSLVARDDVERLRDGFSQEGQAWLDTEQPSEVERATLAGLVENNLEANVRLMVERARAAGAEVLLVKQAQNEATCVSQGDGLFHSECSFDAVGAVIGAVAESTGTAVLDAQGVLRAAAGGPTDDRLFIDRIHHSPAGSQRLGLAVGHALAEMLGGG